MDRSQNRSSANRTVSSTACTSTWAGNPVSLPGVAEERTMKYDKAVWCGRLSLTTFAMV